MPDDSGSGVGPQILLELGKLSTAQAVANTKLDQLLTATTRPTRPQRSRGLRVTLRAHTFLFLHDYPPPARARKSVRLSPMPSVHKFGMIEG